ncbi:MAG TPA: S53 family peptidase [Bryobacteraceae bacterium]|nr:S53 family peptidase [Bryobacteraceae bacterium]
MNPSTHTYAIPGSRRPSIPEAKLLGRSNPAQRITLSIYARQNPHPPAATLRSIDALSTELPGKRRYLSKEEFNSVYGADPADLEKIAAWATANKLSVLQTSVPMRRVQVQGTIQDIEHAFSIELNEYQHPQDGQYRGREGEVHVPADLIGVVEGVFGLDTRRVGHPRRRRGVLRTASLDSVTSTSANPFPGAFFPPQVAQLYNYPSNLDGSKQNIAIFAFNGAPSPDPHGGYSLAALNTYFGQVLGGKTPAIKDVVVQGPGNDPGPDTPASDQQGDSTGEVMLDMCVVGSVAPGASIFMYFTEFTSQGWVDALHEAMTDDNAISVISISYGNPEDDPSGAWSKMGVRVVNQTFQAAIAKGITICCASGDDGSSDEENKGAHVDFPASSPFVLGVGGTKLVAAGGAPPTIAEETVWNELMQDEGAGGGGVSSVFTKPSYQNGVNVPPSVNPPHKIGRGVPDVAAVADPETGVVVMHVDGQQLEAIGGTSAAAPLWASLIARLNQGLGANCGFLNPVLYTKCATGVLRDITVGNNGAYSAGPGWDACTGLGSPDGQRLLHALSSSVGMPAKAGT